MSDKQETVVTNTEKDTKEKANSGRLMLVAVIFVLAGAAGALGYSFLQLSEVNKTLVVKLNHLEQQITSSKTELSGVEQKVSGLEVTAQKSQQLTERQEQMIAGWNKAQQGDLSRWHVAEARYLTNLAKYNLQLTKNGLMAEALLQQASEVLSKVNNPGLDEIRTALQANLTELNAEPQVNIGDLYLKLVAIDKKIDNLPLPSAPLQPDTSDDMAVKKKYEDAPWYKMQWHRTMQAIRKIVIVRYNGNNELPLVLPEEKISLYQNLHAQVEAAMWSVLNHNTTVYDTSLAHMIGWIEKYFVQEADTTRSLLQELKTLQGVHLQPPFVNVAATIQQFDNYLAPHETSKQTVQ